MDNEVLKGLITEFKDLVFKFSKFEIPKKSESITLEKLSWSDFPGVYIIRFENTDYIYVGSSIKSMGSTIWRNGEKLNNQTCCWDGNVVTNKRATLLEYFKLEGDYRFFAPALESFLIYRMWKSGYKLVNKKG